MQDSSRSPVMADVAMLAGVSTMTVSRVINNHPNVTAATRERVEAAISELGEGARPARLRAATRALAALAEGEPAGG